MPNTFRALLTDRSGVSSVMLAVSLPVIVLGVGGGIDMTRAIALRQQVASAIELACKQSAIEVDYKTSQSANPDKDDHKPYVDQLTKTRLADAKLSNVAAASVITAKTISITASTQSQNVFAKVLNVTTVPISLTRDCARSAAPANQGKVLFSESFEINHNVASNSWTVLKDWNGWKTQDAGIEINGIPQLSGNTIRFGNFFAELDSHCYVANCNSNSTMSRELELTPGSYDLRYWYISRIRNPAYAGKIYCGKKDSDASVADATWEDQTNRIEVFFEKEGSYKFARKDIVDICVHTDQWVERKMTIVVDKKAKYRISWRAAGKQDTVGGLIDYLRFCSNTCP